MSDLKNYVMAVPVKRDEEFERLVSVWVEYHLAMEQINRLLPHHPSRLGKCVIPNRGLFRDQRRERYKDARKALAAARSYDAKKNRDAQRAASIIVDEQLKPCPCRRCVDCE